MAIEITVKTDDLDKDEIIAEIESEMRRMIAGETKPYDSGSLIWKKAMGGKGKMSDTRHAMWLIWAALTDWIEDRPEETEAAENEMIRAAKEWFAFNRKDPQECKAYLDRWVYDEVGYERK